MTAKKLFLFLMLTVCGLVFAQQDSIVALNEVTVSDAALRKFSRTQSVSVLNDSVMGKNAASLTSLLNYNSLIYFKENGLGMVSSPSFRGTTASQTAVIWNGLNINSQLNGQTDFNTITTGSFDHVTVRAGGGSSIYGSSAIGGSVHLGNDLRFRNEFSNAVDWSYGSFSTLGVNYKLNASSENVSAQVGISRNSSDNDYEFLDTDGKHNENGQYYNTGFDAAFGYKLSDKHFLKLYSQLFEGERHFSGTIATKSKSKYQDLNSRNLLEWDALLGKFTSKLKAAFLGERYKYFENAKSPIFEMGQAETLVGKYDLGYVFNARMAADLVLDYSKTKGSGKQIGSNERSIGAVSILFRHEPLRWFGYEASARKEITDNYESPFLFAVGTHIDLLKNYSLLLNVSRNFRIPTFNDLYWQGLGNPDLQPESSWQGEVGQRLKWRGLQLSATVYYIHISDMIQWAPDESTGNWTPSNVAEVRSSGVEVALHYQLKFGRHSIDWNSNYAYTISKDAATDEQLIYVPVNKSNTNVAYAYRKFTANYQYMFNGQVFTPSAKYHTLASYQVSNFGIWYDFGKTNGYRLGLVANNFLNENYQSTLQRPMPGRNYSIRLTLNF
jgi:vitamin B12 transporter